MRLLSKFKNINPNDEDTLASLNDPYINYIYDNIYAKMKEVVKLNYGVEPGPTLELGAGSLSKANLYFNGIKQSDGSPVSKFGKENQLIAEDLPFENSTFDLVLAKDTLHHFRDIDLALGEISRVLKPGGIFIVSEPYWSFLGRLVFKFIHPEKWVTKPLQLKNYSTNPFDANQATLLCLLSEQFNGYLSKHSFTAEVFGSTYGLSYMLSGGLNWRNRISFRVLRVVDRIERKSNCFKSLTGLNIIVGFRKY